MDSSCNIIKTNAQKHWPYEEYYIGEKDGEGRKGGSGEHHWTGPKSIEWYRCSFHRDTMHGCGDYSWRYSGYNGLHIIRSFSTATSTISSIEWYTGSFHRDTMHGCGDYRWRYSGFKGLHSTYEGYFYTNDMHGYGVMSYPDGVVFTGIFSNNVRYGPGVETNFTYEDVGLWRGLQLVRLAWKPSCSSIIPDFSQGDMGKNYVEPHRILLASNSILIGEVNSAIDLLKQTGCSPQRAVEKWKKLYPKYCTDQTSKLCPINDFQRDYYKGKIQELNVIDALPEPVEVSSAEPLQDATENTQHYFAWNNDDLLVHMMRHCYKHESQRQGQVPAVDLLSILSGQRKVFKRPGKYEVDCRSLLMASFLGEVHNVTQLINNDDVYPGVTDSKGNSALMYAAFGDQTDIIHFLVEAGANVDSFNDSCCTPLGLTILRFLYIQKDVTPSDMTQALVPPPASPRMTSPREEVNEWNISRETIIHGIAALGRAPSKVLKGGKKSALSLKDAPGKKKDMAKLPDIPEVVSAESISDDKNLYNRINLEYISKINDLFFLPSTGLPVSYIFEMNDMAIGVEFDDDPKKPPDKNAKKIASKIIKQTTRPSKEAMWRSSDKDISSMESEEKQKVDLLSKVMFTILQLLSDGANPCLVRCPQPAILMAVFAGCPDLVLQVMLYGADVNEKYPQMLDYTPLDIAISQPMTHNNLDLVRTLLECGSDTNHRLRFQEFDEEIPGPTLLHVLLTRKIENDAEIEIQHELLELLLQYRCDPLVQFKGRSAVDIALSKGANILDIFIENPGTNLNAIINDTNQTILVKMFSLPFFKTANPSERLQTITNLLLFGADPLIQCRNDEEIFENIFVFMKKTILELENGQGKSNPATAAKDQKGKPPPPKEKPKPTEKLAVKPSTRSALDDVGDYRQAQELMADCARMLFIRWLQAKLMKELVIIINRFQHRHWNMILREHKNKKPTGLWLTAERCLEIWDILKTTRQKLYKNNRILKHLLCMVMFYNKRYKEQLKETTPTAQIKNAIEADVTVILRDYKTLDQLKEDMEQLKRPYVKPELTSDADKFNVCFECIIPHEEDTIKCKSCNQVAFCSMECMKVNSDRPFCHPCAEYLKQKYFPALDSSDDEPTNK